MRAMTFYEKLNAKHWQEEAAMHSEWALDYLIDGQIEKSVRHQRISAEYAENARCGMWLSTPHNPEGERG